LSANKKKLSRREAQADNDAELDESAEDVVPEPVRRNNPSSAFISAEGESKDKIEIGTRQFVRFTDALPFTPTKGDFDVNNIRSSPYFFS
jgi:DNA-directed RNA polymerase